MGKAKAAEASEPMRKMRPALDPDVREQQLISMAVDLAERQFRDGTASSQVTTEYLKRGSPKALLEIEKLRKEIQLLEAKTQAIKDTQRMEEVYTNAMNAFKMYSGQAVDIGEVEGYDEY